MDSTGNLGNPPRPTHHGKLPGSRQRQPRRTQRRPCSVWTGPGSLLGTEFFPGEPGLSGHCWEKGHRAFGGRERGDVRGTCNRQCSKFLSGRYSDRGRDLWAPSATSVSVHFHDRRLEPFLERLSRVERGEWGENRGRRPSRQALAKAQAILRRLSGGALVPKRSSAQTVESYRILPGARATRTSKCWRTGALLMLNSDGINVPEVRRFALRDLPSAIEQYPCPSRLMESSAPPRCCEVPTLRTTLSSTLPRPSFGE